jgi:sporulation protein YlmC with PRC-barrel domain
MSATTMLGEWTGRQVLDTQGEKIGTVQDVLYDDAVDRPEWLVVKTGLFGTKRILVPARDVRTEGDKLMVPYTEDRAKDAPHVANQDAPSQDEERELYLYYGLDYPEPAPPVAPSSTPGPEPAASQPSPTPPSSSGDRGEQEGAWGPGGNPAEQEDILTKRHDQ